MDSKTKYYYCLIKLLNFLLIKLILVYLQRGKHLQFNYSWKQLINTKYTLKLLLVLTKLENHWNNLKMLKIISDYN